HAARLQRAILRPLRHPLYTQRNAYILRSYVSAHIPKPTPGPTKPYQHEKAPPPEQSWLTRKLKQSPTAMKCHLPPTFQSWFMVTNLHIWMFTTRLRAFPAPHAQAHIQGLIDHFFLDVEDRIRQVLQPQSQAPGQTPASTAEPTTAPARPTTFYGASPPPTRHTAAPPPPRSAAARLKRSAPMPSWPPQCAQSAWRARRADLALALAPTSPVPEFRRAVNPGGAVARLSEPARVARGDAHDGSGVHDFGPEERDAYVQFTETMLVLTVYIRAEIARLAAIPDEDYGPQRGAGAGAEGVAAATLRKDRKCESAFG
ncbi:hypothetical protein EDB84DRAFT_1612197, partial [Lactarius hengduanensis]